jgi:hypothetical protein
MWGAKVGEVQYALLVTFYVLEFFEWFAKVVCSNLGNVVLFFLCHISSPLFAHASSDLFHILALFHLPSTNLHSLCL